MDRGDWQFTVHAVAEPDTTERLSTGQHMFFASKDGEALYS